MSVTPHEPMLQPADQRDMLLELHAALVDLARGVGELVGEVAPAQATVEDIDLTQANPQRSVWANEDATAAVQVDNPYTVELEVHASRDGGGPVIMRVPPQSTRVQNVRVRDLSVRAIGVPAGPIPATLTRYDRSQPPGVYPYGISLLGTAVVGNVATGAADDGSDPVKIGGVYHATKPVYADGERAEALFDARGQLRVALGVPDSAANVNATGAGLLDALGLGGANGMFVAAVNYGVNGTNNGDRFRIPNVFKTIAGLAVVAGTPQAIWTPAAGKKFRLMGFVLEPSVAAAVILLDAAAEILRIGSPAASSVSSPPMGNGILSAAANNALNINVSANATIHGFVFGTEE